MSEQSSSGKCDPKLPAEVRNLIIRKLRYQRREQERLLASAKQAAYRKLHEEVSANISARRLGQAFISAPLAAYREITASATAVTKELPGIVWKTIASTLEKAQVVPCDGQELNAIVNEFAWAIGQKPYTLGYIDPERFKGTVYREASRYGITRKDDLASFDDRLKLAAALAECGILNTARQARDGIGIAIDEYLISQRHVGHPGTNPSVILALVNPPSASAPQPKGKAKKRKTQPEGADQEDLEIGTPKWREQTARKAANARHNKPGGSRDKQQRIREIWATGKYSSRDRCAEEECAALGMSFKAARNALINAPKPKKPPRC